MTNEKSSSLRKPNRAPLHAARHERAIRVAYYGVELRVGAGPLPSIHHVADEFHLDFA